MKKLNKFTCYTINLSNMLNILTSIILEKFIKKIVYNIYYET